MNDFDSYSVKTILVNTLMSCHGIYATDLDRRDEVDGFWSDSTGLHNKHMFSDHVRRVSAASGGRDKQNSNIAPHTGSVGDRKYDKPNSKETLRIDGMSRTKFRQN